MRNLNGRFPLQRTIGIQYHPFIHSVQCRRGFIQVQASVIAAVGMARVICLSTTQPSVRAKHRVPITILIHLTSTSRALLSLFVSGFASEPGQE